MKKSSQKESDFVDVKESHY